MRLTVIFRNEAAAINHGEPPTHRRVTLDLTPEQTEALKRQPVCHIGDQIIREQVSQVFLEE